MQKKKRKVYLIIASMCIFAIAVNVYATREQMIFARIANVLVCAIEHPPSNAQQASPKTRCATNDGNTITIVHNRTENAIEDTVIPLP